MSFHARADETAEWLNYLQPEGLVVGANVLREKGLSPIRQTPLDTEAAAAALGLDPEAPREDDRHLVLREPWPFLQNVLGWQTQLVAGSPGGPTLPPNVCATVPEHGTLLTPDMALLWRGEAEDDLPAQALVMVQPELDPDRRDQFGAGEWEASPHQRLERLLRETRIGVGILIARNTLRLIYAPRGETAGWMSWPLAALGRVEGRPMLAGLKLCLGPNAFFMGAAETRLRALLKASRESQNEVSEKLSGQVLGALHELLRGLHRADPGRIEALAESDSHRLYEGVLTCLMRLVFLLYAEDRDLLPSATEPKLRQLWESGYSVKTLYARLLVDEALNPDTMDERRGGWGQLLAVFRLIHDGHPGWIARRGGKLFDPDAFAFLEGRERGSVRGDAGILPVSDGTILRILHGLMTIEARSVTGEKIRERLSYRSLDVESIGSVYETVMGFTTCRATDTMVALKDEKKLPTFIGLDSLLAQKPAERQKWLKELAIKLSAKQMAAVKQAQDVTALLAGLRSAIDERASPSGEPLSSGAPYLQPTEERRRSGSHYTPRSLTEPIVRHALEPAFERIGPEAGPEAVLALRVLDLACGSGAFLVEACRQLGARLEQAWDMHEAERPEIPADEDAATHARRLVAQRCLYGVDRNPMAVDLARLSLWLTTLAREHEFSFLDHALKVGDSLVGLTRKEIQAVRWDASKPGLPLFRSMIEKAVGRALEGREAIRNAADDVTLTVQTARHRRVEDEVEPARIVGDAVVAAFFAADKTLAREMERQKVESVIAASIEPDWDRLRGAARAFGAERGWRPFHWEIEFPEVFEREGWGFDAIVGNPPFAGKNTISAASGSGYLPWLQTLHEGAHGNADLVAHFFRRAFGLLRQGGTFGLIATNTIGQGDTRDTGLATLLKQKASIYRAVKRYQWPNEGAAVVVSIVHLIKGGDLRVPVLDGRPVTRISAYLVDGQSDSTPARLEANAGQAFQGSILLGIGFTFDDAAAAKGDAEPLSEMTRLVSIDQRNAERIKPFIGSSEVNSSPTHANRRYTIDFEDFPLKRDLAAAHPWEALTTAAQKDQLRLGIVARAYPGPVAEDWPALVEIVERRVKPQRAEDKRPARRDRWWRFGDRQPGLYAAIDGEWVLVHGAAAAAHHAFARLKSEQIFSHKLVVLAQGRSSSFCILQSRIHEVWNRREGSTFGDGLTYNPSDVFETFPFPPGHETNPALDAAGQIYHDLRAALMVEADEGMTKTYNRFHDDTERRLGVHRLRDLHDEMDCAVLRAYGWNDLAETLRPAFLTPETEDDHTYQGRFFWPAEGRDIVLSRLLALNAERHAEEVAAGLGPAKGKRRKTDEETEETDLLD